MKKILLLFLGIAGVFPAFSAVDFPPVKTVLLEERFVTQEDIGRNWQLEQLNGAKGKVEIDYQITTPDSSPTLCLEKLNTSARISPSCPPLEAT